LCTKILVLQKAQVTYPVVEQAGKDDCRAVVKPLSS